MISLPLIGFGIMSIFICGLFAVYPSIMDKYYRIAQSWGTKQTAADVEMTQLSITVGRIAGVVIVFYGIRFVLLGL
jgi:hypothetical protein